jgi:hypothetical protein
MECEFNRACSVKAVSSFRSKPLQTSPYQGGLEFGLLLPRPLREGAGGWGKSLQALQPDNLQDSLNSFNYIVVPKP